MYVLRISYNNMHKKYIFTSYNINKRYLYYLQIIKTCEEIKEYN